MQITDAEEIETETADDSTFEVVNFLNFTPSVCPYCQECLPATGRKYHCRRCGYMQEDVRGAGYIHRVEVDGPAWLTQHETVKIQEIPTPPAVDKNRARSIVGDTQAHNTRPEADFYPTPSRAIKALLAVEEFPGIVWEPACGDGAISKYLPQDYLMSSDLYDRGYGETGIDFLLEFREVNHIITNPPFRVAQEFIEHALGCVVRGGKVAMLLKLQFLEGVSRQAFFKTSGLARVHVFSKRIRMDANKINDKESGGMLAFAWFVFELGFRGKPEIGWI